MISCELHILLHKAKRTGEYQNLPSKMFLELVTNFNKDVNSDRFEIEYIGCVFEIDKVEMGIFVLKKV